MHFVLSEEQYEKLSADAKACGLSKRKYLIRLIEGRPIVVRPTEHIDKLRIEVHHIGNNINQIARKYNAGFGTPEDARMIQFLMEKVYRLMYEIAKE